MNWNYTDPFVMEHGHWIHTWSGEIIHSDETIAKQHKAMVNNLVSEKDIKVFPKDEVILRKYKGSGMFEKVIMKVTTLNKALDEIVKDRDGYNGYADITSIYEKEFPLFNGTCLQKIVFPFIRKFVDYGKKTESYIAWT